MTALLAKAHEQGARALCVAVGIDPDKSTGDERAIHDMFAEGNDIPVWELRRAEAESCIGAALEVISPPDSELHRTIAGLRADLARAAALESTLSKLLGSASVALDTAARAAVDRRDARDWAGLANTIREALMTGVATGSVRAVRQGDRVVRVPDPAAP
jgi:hypothetical protein